MRLPALRLSAVLIDVPSSRFGLEDEVLFDVDPKSLASFFDADFLTILLDLAVPGAEALGAVLALAHHRLSTAAQATAMLAVRCLAILTNLHPLRPS